MEHHHESLTVVHIGDLGDAPVLRCVSRVRHITQAARVNEVSDWGADPCARLYFVFFFLESSGTPFLLRYASLPLTFG